MAQTEKHRIDAAERARVQHANNTAAIIQEIGAMPDNATLTAIRVNTLIDHLIGEIEIDPETGAWISGGVERLEYERDVGEKVYEFLLSLKEQVVAQRNAPKLLLPEHMVGGAGSPTAVMPGTPGLP